MLRSVLAGCRQGLLGGLAALALAVGVNMLFVDSAFAQHKMNADDMELAIDDPQVVDFGREKYAQRCSFCHGGGGKGGKGPCLACGRFRYSGNTNTEIYATIAGGVSNRSLGGTMGAFGTTMSFEEIQAVITFLRSEERRRIKEGEIEDPYQR